MYSWFDRFCYRHRRYGIRNLMLYIVIGNAAVFLLDPMGLENLYAAIAFSPALVLQGQWWRVFTFVFIPPTNSLIFIIFALYFYYWIGNSLENHWGILKFNIFYFSGVLFSIIYACVSVLLYSVIGGVPIASQNILTLDASYVNLSLFLAFATLFPDIQIRVFFVLPIKVKWLAIITVVFMLGLPLLSAPISVLSFSPVIALANYILYFGKHFYTTIMRKQKNTRRTYQFESALRKAKKEKGYIHKCVVCGKTDTDSPDTEFRYCSLCSGYQCYCSEHIFGHTHKRG